MALYDAFGVTPSRDGSGIAAKPLSHAMIQLQAKQARLAAMAVAGGEGKSASAGLTLLDVVRQRANLERKLRQDDFLTKFASSSAPQQPLMVNPHLDSLGSGLSSPSGGTGTGSSRATSQFHSGAQSPASEKPEVSAARRARMAELHALQMEDEAERQAAQMEAASIRPTSGSSTSAKSSMLSSPRQQRQAFSPTLSVGSNGNGGGGGGDAGGASAGASALPSPAASAPSAVAAAAAAAAASPPLSSPTLATPRFNFSSFFVGAADGSDGEEEDAAVTGDDGTPSGSSSSRWRTARSSVVDVSTWLEQRAQERKVQAAVEAAAQALLPHSH